MASTVINPRKWYEFDDLESALMEIVPRFVNNAEEDAYTVTSKVKDIIEHELYKRVGFDSFDAYAEKVLDKPVDWFDRVANVIGPIGKSLANERAAKAKRDATEIRPGGNNNPLGLGGKSGKVVDDGIVNSYNITIDKQLVDDRGTSISYTLRRLARNHPDLLERYAAGELTANAAAIQAGFRKPTWTAPCDPDTLAAAIRRKFGEQFAQALAQELLKG